MQTFEVRITDLTGKVQWGAMLFKSQTDADMWIAKHKLKNTWGKIEGQDYAVQVVDISLDMEAEAQKQASAKNARKNSIQQLKSLDMSKNLTNSELQDAIKEIIQLLT